MELTTITMLLKTTLISCPSVITSHSLAVMILDLDPFYWAGFMEEARVEVDRLLEQKMAK